MAVSIAAVKSFSKVAVGWMHYEQISPSWCPLTWGLIRAASMTTNGVLCWSCEVKVCDGDDE